MLKRVIFVTAFVACGLSSMNASCVEPSDFQAKLSSHADAKTFADLGAWFEGRHNYPCATQAYRSALRLNPASPQLFERLGSSLYSAGDLSGAVDGFHEAIKLAPAGISAHLKLAMALEQLQRKEEAREEWEMALRIDPQSKAALDGFSQHALGERDYGAVIARLASRERDEKLTLDLAEAYGRAEMLKEADELLTTASLQSPDSFSLANALVTVQVNEGFRERALRTAEQFARKHHENSEAQKLWLRTLLANEETAEALPLAHKLLAAAPHDVYFLYVAGVMEQQNGQYTVARNHLEEAVALQPDVYKSHYQLGLVLAKLNDPRGAKDHFERALSLGAPESQVHFELAMVLKTLGETAAAAREIRLYKDVSQSQSNRSTRDAKAAQAEKELDSGNPSRAAILYREALETSPDDALLNYKLSLALGKAGDASGERSALERAITIDPDMAIAQNQLGYLASRSGDLVSAETHFRQAVKSAPQFTEAWVNLAATLGMESNFQEAQAAIDKALKLAPENKEALELRQELARAGAQH